MASSTEGPIDLLKLISKFRTLTEHPTDFLSKNQSRSDGFKNLSKSIFDHVRTCKNIPHSSALPELLTGVEFDDEQVWQQLELDNKLSIDTAVKNVAGLLVQGEAEFFGFAAGSPPRNELPTVERKNDGESGIESHESDSEEGDHHFENPLDSDNDAVDEEDDEAIARGDEESPSEGDEELDEDDEEEEMPQRPRPSGPPSALDDEFFKLSDMNDFILEDEKRGDRAAGEEIDYFADYEEESERDEEDYKYDDFFDPVQSNQQSATAKLSTGKNTEKSTFEKRQEKLQDRIKSMEEEAVSAKPWQLGGEISAGKRPENSLLEEFLQFDHVMRQPPVITEEVSQKLEDLIVQRIKDKAWDDVQRKVKAKDVDPYEYKKKLVLEESKAKQSLSQIYEQEFLKKIATTDQEEEKPEHRSIRKSLNDLVVKLDALSNFHFVPKPVAPEIKIVNNLPTLVVEEIQPSTVATSQLLAPEEVQPKKKGDLTGPTEASETDKNRSRRKKKLRQKIKAQHQKGKEEINSKALKKSEKAKAKGGSSGAFFDKLQDTVKAEQAAKSLDGKESKKRKKDTMNTRSVKKFKL